MVRLVMLILCDGMVAADSYDATCRTGHKHFSARKAVPRESTATEPFSPLPVCLAQDAQQVAGYLNCLRHVAHEIGIENATSVGWDASARAIRVLDARNTTISAILWPGLRRVPGDSNSREPRQAPLFEGCLFEACEPPPPPLPPVGCATLSLDARIRSRGGAHPRSSRFELLTQKLRAGMAVHVLAAGASPTAMFASHCIHGKCMNGLPVIARINTSGPTRRVQSDFLLQFLQSLQLRFPLARITASTSAMGGARAGTFAGCPSDMLCHGMVCPDLIILELALIGHEMKKIEQIFRFLPNSTAVVMLNFVDWCAKLGRLEFEENGFYSPAKTLSAHTNCQRSLRNRTRTRRALARLRDQDVWHEKLAALAHHYGHESVSMFSALRPALAAGTPDAFDLTQDGLHPSYYCVRDGGGCVAERSAHYNAFTADALAHAIDASIMDPTARANEPVAGASQWLELPELPELPTPLSPLIGNEVPVRCWRENQLRCALQPVQPTTARAGAIARCIHRGWSVGSNNEWRWLDDDLHFSSAAGGKILHGRFAGEWQPMPRKNPRPGLNSVVPGDNVTFSLDTRVPTGRQAVLALQLLTSYNQVGIVLVECVDAGCPCEPVTFDALRPSKRHAIHDHMSLNISQSATCLVRVTNISPEYVTPASLHRHHQPQQRQKRRACPVDDAGPCTKLKLYQIHLSAHTPIMSIKRLSHG